MTALQAAQQLEQALTGAVPPKDQEALGQSLATILTQLDFSMSYGELDDIQGRGNGPFARLAKRLAEIYGARHARLMPHGSSLANVSMALGLKFALGRPPRILAERTLHMSSLGGMILAGAEVDWIDRVFVTELGIQHPIRVDDLNSALRKRQYDAVWLTLPTYTGFLSDTRQIHATCQQHGARLIADSAWGGYQSLVLGFPKSPAFIADATVISMHKVGLGRSGASVALFNDTDLLSGYERATELGFVSTSPPYSDWICVEQALEFWLGPRGKTNARRMKKATTSLAGAIGALPGVTHLKPELLGTDVVGNPSHLLFRTAETGVTGYKLHEEIAKRRIDVEMASLDTLMFLCGPDTITRWRHIADEVKQVIFEQVRKVKGTSDLPPPPVRPTAVLTMAEAVFRRTHQALPARDAVGHISGQAIAAYPPGSALLVPGERITPDVVEYLLALEAEGSRLKGLPGKLCDVGIQVIS